MARAPQVGVRRALGASRRSIFLQHLIEQTQGEPVYKAAFVGQGNKHIGWYKFAGLQLPARQSLHSRQATRLYIKAVRRGVADSPLSAEEVRAMQSAGITPTV